MSATEAPASCPLCGGASALRWSVGDRLFRTSDARSGIHRCVGCELYFLWPIPSASALASAYPEGYWRGDDEAPERDARGALTEWYRRLLLRDHVRFVSRAVEAQRSAGVWRGLLDVGCGDGSVLAAFGARPAVGLDRSADAVRFVTRRGLAAVRGTLENAPFAERSFSLVTMFHYLEHVRPALAPLESARRLLAPGGELIVQVPNAASWGALLLGRRWQGFDPPRHLIDYTPASLAATLERAGFRVVAQTQHCLRDNPASVAMSLLPAAYPPARIARGIARESGKAWLADLAWLGLTWAVTPFCWLESAAGRGESLMVRCRVV